MISATGRIEAGRRGGSIIGGIGAVLRAVLEWPGQVYRARQLMHQLGRMADHELRDIGLTRQDLHDVTALACDADPSLALRRRVEERRLRRR